MTACFATRRDLRKVESGFTLIELMVVIGVVAVLAAVIFSGLRGSDATVTLRSAQATMANALNAARTLAISKGVNVGLLINNDTGDAEHYRRLIVLVEDINGSSSIVSSFNLPDGIYVIPHKDRFTEGMRQEGSWIGGDSGGEIGSSFLRYTTSLALMAGDVQLWEYREFTPNGTMTGGTGGDIVVATAKKQPDKASSYPIVYESPEQVRGLTISTYGMARMTNGRQDL
jgi:prepilin-type N-terminal cleavage/methylation domain-containing protein